MPSGRGKGKKTRVSEWEAYVSASLVSCPGTALVWGLTLGREAPSMSRTEGRAITNDFAATGLNLAFQS